MLLDLQLYSNKYIFYSVFETPHFTNDQLSPKAGVPGTAGVLEGTVASPFVGGFRSPWQSMIFPLPDLSLYKEPPPCSKSSTSTALRVGGFPVHQPSEISDNKTKQEAFSPTQCCT